MSTEQHHPAGKNIIRSLLRGVCDILYPGICPSCGSEATELDAPICPFCLNERFEDANRGNSISSSGLLLPEGVSVQHALWQYDKGGELQRLLHGLKYEHLTRIGFQMGKMVAKRMQLHPELLSLIQESTSLLVPVPLHFLRFVRRGYNQAYYIAAGIREELHIAVVNSGDVVRRINTRSQTALGLSERLLNVRGAFEVVRPEIFRDRVIFIVDDVITTGATTFELSRELLAAGAKTVAVLTIAQA